jgi:hypothetical protein
MDIVVRPVTWLWRPKSASLAAFPSLDARLSLFAAFSTFIHIRGIAYLPSSDPYAFALLFFPFLEWWMYHAFSIVFHGDPRVLISEATTVVYCLINRYFLGLRYQPLDHERKKHNESVTFRSRMRFDS